MNLYHFWQTVIITTTTTIIIITLIRRLEPNAVKTLRASRRSWSPLVPIIIFISSITTSKMYLSRTNKLVIQHDIYYIVIIVNHPVDLDHHNHHDHHQQLHLQLLLPLVLGQMVWQTV